jgi:hypothetical protein
MSYNYVRSMTGTIFLIFHFIVLLACVIFRMIDWFDEMTLNISLAILVPLLAPYTIRILKMLLQNKHQFAKGKPVNRGYTTAVSFVIGVFILLIIGIILKQAIQPSSIKTFMESLGSVEAIFSISIEAIISDLLGHAESKSPSRSISSGSAIRS